MGWSALIWTAVAVLLLACWPRIEANWRWEAAAVTGVLALSAAHQALFNTLAEDAYITYRYAANLAEGNGPVFNIGERVEGYSNFLWMVLLALPRSVADLDIVLVARALGVAATLASLVALHVLVRRVTGTAQAGVLAVLLAAGAGSLAAYGPSGLETPLFTLLVSLMALAAVADRPAVAGVLVALATMTRPDGVVVAAVVGLWLVSRHRWSRCGWRDAAWYAAAALALALPWLIWRYVYYGHLVPNALTAKSGLELRWQLASGWHYLVGFFGAAAALLVLVPLAVFALAARRANRDLRAAGWLLFAVAACYVGFVVAAGGDWMPAWRLFAPAVPLLAGGVAIGWAAAAGRLPAILSTSGRGATLVALVVTALLIATSVRNAFMVPRVAAWRQQVVELAELGSWMHRTLPPGTVVSTYANGSLSYHAAPAIPVVDQLGLTDEHIARRGHRDPHGVVGHAAHDYDYVVNVRRPAVVFTTGSGFARTPGCEVPGWLGSQYVGRAFQFDGQQVWAVVFLRATRADELTALLDADPPFRLVPCAP